MGLAKVVFRSAAPLLLGLSASACDGRVRSLNRLASGGASSSQGGDSNSSPPTFDWAQVTWELSPNDYVTFPSVQAPSAPAWLDRLASPGPNEVWGLRHITDRCGGGAQIWHLSGDEWTQVFVNWPTECDSFDRVTPDGSLMVTPATTTGMVMQVHGSSIEQWAPSASLDTHSLFQGARAIGVSATSLDNVWLNCEGGGVAHWDGSSWSSFVIDDSNAVFARAADDVWLAGAAGKVNHWDGADWSQYTLGTSAFLDVWAGAPDDAWLLNSAGELYHYEGTAGFSLVDSSGQPYSNWQLQPNESDWNTAGVALFWGTSSTNIWAIVKRQTLAHWNGSRWTEINDLPSQPFQAITGNPTELWIEGDSYGLWRGSPATL